MILTTELPSVIGDLKMPFFVESRKTLGYNSVFIDYLAK